MKYCSHCGNEVIEQAVVCTKCGCRIQNTAENTFSPQKDEADVGLLVISVIVPIVGFILWALKQKETPQAAKKYGMAALIVCGAYVALYVLVMILISSTVSGIMSSI